MEAQEIRMFTKQTGVTGDKLERYVKTLRLSRLAVSFDNLEMLLEMDAKLARQAAARAAEAAALKNPVVEIDPALAEAAEKAHWEARSQPLSAHENSWEAAKRVLGEKERYYATKLQRQQGPSTGTFIETPMARIARLQREFADNERARLAVIRNR